MANKKLVDFITAENALDGNEDVYIAQGGKTRKTLLQKIKDFVIGTSSMGTTATDVTGAVKEINDKIGEINVATDGDVATQLNDCAKKTDKAITYYVNSSSGSDSNNGLASDTAFKTIQHAINILPQVINGAITINLAEGSYDQINIGGFYGKGSINLLGNPTIPSNFNIPSVDINNTAIKIALKGIKVNAINGGKGINITNCPYVSINSCEIIESDSTGYGIIATFACVEVLNSTISNKFSAICSNTNSKIFSENNVGSNNSQGLSAWHNGEIGKNGTQPSGTVAEDISAGGIIR